MSDLLEAIAALPNYEVERLDAATELNRFGACLKAMGANAGHITAEAACIASQRVLYALDELKWSSQGSTYEHLLRKAEKLLKSATQFQKEALAKAGKADAARVAIYFRNIARRHEELANRLGQI